MKRPGVFGFNVLLAVLLAGAYALGVVERRASVEGVEAAFLSTWWAGLTVGMSVGAGATFGPRPMLGWKRCLRVQVMIVLTSALFALLLWFLPREFTSMDRLMEEELSKRGLRTGSGIGAAVGTVIQIVQVYLLRRRAARRP